MKTPDNNEITDLVNKSMSSNEPIIILKIKLKGSNEFIYGKAIALGALQPRAATPMKPTSPICLKKVSDIVEFKKGHHLFEQKEINIDALKIDEISIEPIS